jgi:chemotaxis signal transduction protein
MRQAAGSDSLLGVMVDELGEIPEVPLDRIEKVSSMLEGGDGLAESLIKPGTGKDAREMIVVLSTDRLWRKFMRVSECV